LALIGIASIPGNNLDLYLRDTYFVVSKFALAVVTLLALVLPLAAVTIPRVRAAR
jgi:heme/copper-type cytochrome/quinol oxidase subunit 1